MKKLFGNIKHKDSSSPSLNDPVDLTERSSNSLDCKTKYKDKMKKYKDYKPQTSSAQSLPMGLPFASNLQHSEQLHHNKYASEDESSSMTSGSGLGANLQNYNTINLINAMNSGESSASPSKRHNKSNTLNSTQNSNISQNAVLTNVNSTVNFFEANSFVRKEEFDKLLIEFKLKKEAHQKLSEELDSLKNQYQNEFSIFNQSLQEERERHDRLEEQMNDLIELHQNEVENLKQIISDMEEKVQYQSEDRLRDMNELLENCQTRISRMEHQQHQQFQQLVGLDGVENSRKALFTLINIALNILQVVLLFVSTTVSMILPFLKTRFRMFTTIIFLSFTFLLFRQKQEIFLYLADKIDKKYLSFINFLSFYGPNHNASNQDFHNT